MSIFILQVSWFRKEDGILTVLTIGKSAFIADERFSSAYRRPHDWRLRIKPTNPRDGAHTFDQNFFVFDLDLIDLFSCSV